MVFYNNYNNKAFLTLFLLLVFFQKNEAQTALAIGSQGGDEVVSMDIFQNNIILGGTFQQALGTVTAKGGSDVFLQQYDLTGNLQWQYILASPSNENLAKTTCSPNGTIYSTGIFSDNLEFGQNDTILQNNQLAIFISKQNQQGQLLWAKKLQGKGWLKINDILSDAQDNIYITGAFKDSFQVDATHALFCNKKSDFFLIKINAQGHILWARQAVLGIDTEGISLAWNDSGELYFAGHFKDYFSLFPQDSFRAHWTYNDIFLTKIDSSNGTAQWQKHYGGVYENACKKILWNNGFLYMAGSFIGVLKIDKDTLITAFRDWNGYVAKLNPDGTSQWAVQSQTQADCFVESFDFYNNAIVVCGSFSDTLYWENQRRIATNNSDAFQLVLNDQGQLLKLDTWFGNGFDLAKSIRIHTAGQVVTVGAFQQNLTIGNFTLQAQGFSDGFLSIQLPLVLPNSIQPIEKENFAIKTFPNPAKDLVYINAENLVIEKWELYTANGQLILQGNEPSFSVENLSIGTYFLKVWSGEKAFVGRVLVGR